MAGTEAAAVLSSTNVTTRAAGSGASTAALAAQLARLHELESQMAEAAKREAGAEEAGPSPRRSLRGGARRFVATRSSWQ